MSDVIAYTFRIKRWQEQELIVSYITKFLSHPSEARKHAVEIKKEYEDKGHIEVEVKFKEGLGGEWWV